MFKLNPYLFVLAHAGIFGEAFGIGIPSIRNGITLLGTLYVLLRFILELYLVAGWLHLISGVMKVK